MASGDLILSSGTVITAAEIQQIAAEVKKELAAESKELAEFEEVSSLTGVSSLPGIQQSGTSMKLVRVAMSVLKGVDGRDIELSASQTAIQWRYVGTTEWFTLVDISLLKGNKGDPGEPVVLRKGDTGIEWKLQSEPDTAYRTLVAVSDLRFSFSDLTDEEKGEITKIPILSEVSATPGVEPSGAFVSAGRDAEGNPVYTLNLVLPQGEQGVPPVIELGTVTTLLPDTEASATLVPNGTTDEGNPKYLLNLSLPAGRPGQDGNGAGNVYINEAEKMESGKLYLFQPGADGMVNGYFVEYVGQQSVGQKNPDYPGAELFNDYVNNIAAGQYAHAEGRETNATGPRAHAEGYKTTVYAADAHAEGRETVCIGAQSHAEGMYSIAFGANSHVEGIAAQIENGSYTLPSEGRKQILSDPELIRSIWDEYGTTMAGDISISSKLFENYYIHASFGERNHVEGINNIVSYNGVHVEGSSNIVGYSVTEHGALYIDHVAHVEGSWNICKVLHSDSSVHIEGKENELQGMTVTHISADGTDTSENYYVTAAHIEGRKNQITTIINADENQYKRAEYSHVGGYLCTIRAATCAFAHGYNLSVSNDYEAAFGFYNLSILNDKKVLFSYGIGSSTERKNAFSVLEDGTVVIPVLEAENMKAEIDAAVAPISTKVNNNYNELKAIVDEQAKQIADLLKLIQEGGGGSTPNAYVIGSMLVITSRLESSVSGETLTITDSDASVTDEVLTIN